MTNENKAIMRRALEEVVNQGNLDLIDELVGPNFVDHTPFPGLPPTREGVRQTIKMLREAFPDLHVTSEELVAEGDMVVSRQSTRGTHKGEFMGVPPTEKEVTWTGILMFRISDGQIVGQWLEQDVMGLMQQLGVVSMPEPE
jgi:predicted ester cyclase